LSKKTPSIDGLSMEESLKKLEKVVAALESGDLPLEESVQAYTYGVKLVNHSEKLLASSQNRIESILEEHNGGK
jgi:exodeoxyribonuclease VII small subunit